MKEKYAEQFKIIMTKTVNGKTFTLELHARPDEEYKEVSHYDYIIGGPNWLSGYLKAQGYTEIAIFEFFEECSMDDVSDAWCAHYERVRGA